MSVALDDIWDAPAASTSPRRKSPDDVDDDGGPSRANKRRRSQPLFLGDDSDDDDAAPGSSRQAPRTPSASAAPDIDAMFEDLDNDEPQFEGLAPTLDVNALRRAAEDKHARAAPLTPHAIMPSSSPPRDGDAPAERWKDRAEKGKDGEKKKKTVARMDETRLMGPDGFPALINMTKDFKPRGKGHEVNA
jgi:replication fork protection complex subunit Csm3/Swi3